MAGGDTCGSGSDDGNALVLPGLARRGVWFVRIQIDIGDMTLEQADKAARAQEVVDGAANSEDCPTDDE